MFEEPVNHSLSAGVVSATDDFGTGALAGGAEFTHAAKAREANTTMEYRIISAASKGVTQRYAPSPAQTVGFALEFRAGFSDTRRP
jgi:hypothetical protein